MIRVSQVKLPVGHTEQELKNRLAKMLRISPEHLLHYRLVKKSIDSRRRDDVCYVYTIDVKVKHEQKVLKKAGGPKIKLRDEKKYIFPKSGDVKLKERPIIVGTGPAGLYCGLMLAERGYRPILLERGAPVEEREKAVEAFWQGEPLNADTNVQFGEGGAGTYSDGKLNTLVKDVSGRNKKVLEIFTEAGAPEEILYLNKPHIGTDILKDVVKNIREKIISLGGEVRFHSQVTDIETAEGRVASVTLSSGEKLPCEILVLALGHSARDTMEMLFKKQVPMEQKSFAVGLRMEHPQEFINEMQYGSFAGALPAADYKVTAKTSSGRGVYSFCMCPGGYVVNASSEPEMLAVNGMSYHARDGRNANSAIIVTVGLKDYGSLHPLAGMEFQRRLEKNAYRAGNGKIPIQLFGDFEAGRMSTGFGAVRPAVKGEAVFGDLRSVLPEELNLPLIEGIHQFDRQIHGFSGEDAILLGVESRTSSPLRMERDENMESSVKGLYPCGEGAGYAGGITSAALDGIRVAEAIALRYRP